MKTVSYFDKTFEIFISAEEINNITDRLAAELNAAYEKISQEIIMVSILDGSFVFMADLVRKLKFKLSIEFVKIKSYEGTESLGEVSQMLKLNRDINNCHVLVIEDIIDTGLTIEVFLQEIKKQNPSSIKICALLSKPEVHNDIIPLDFIGKEIPPLFVIGYGLDINGLGRNLSDIYSLVI